MAVGDFKKPQIDSLTAPETRGPQTHVAASSWRSQGTLWFLTVSSPYGPPASLACDPLPWVTLTTASVVTAPLALTFLTPSYKDATMTLPFWYPEHSPHLEILKSVSPAKAWGSGDQDMGVLVWVC